MSAFGWLDFDVSLPRYRRRPRRMRGLCEKSCGYGVCAGNRTWSFPYMAFLWFFWRSLGFCRGLSTRRQFPPHSLSSGIKPFFIAGIYADKAAYSARKPKERAKNQRNARRHHNGLAPDASPEVTSPGGISPIPAPPGTSRYDTRHSTRPDTTAHPDSPADTPSESPHAHRQYRYVSSDSPGRWRARRRGCVRCESPH